MEEDVVALILNGEHIEIAKEYDISIAFLQVPNAGSITIGSGSTFVDLARRYPKGTTCALQINGVTQFMGRTDGFRRTRGDATEMALVFRDALALFVKDKIQHDRTFNNITFDELTKEAFKSAGYEGISLVYSAAAHRAAVAGTPILETAQVTKKILIDLNQIRGLDTSGVPKGADLNYQPLDIDPTIEITETVTKCTGFKAEKPIQWKAGTPHYDALNKELARAGIFLRAGVDPEGQDPNVFLLSEPNATQAPAFGLARILGDAVPDNHVSVLPPAIDDIATGRHSHYIVRGRTGGGADGRQQIEAVFVDEEMAAIETSHEVIIDESAKTLSQAQFIARRACATARRMCRCFTYTVPNRHTLPLLADPRRRAIPNPDMVVALRDDEHGMEGLFWIERVRFRRSMSTGTNTDITLMCPEDLVFGDGQYWLAGKKGQKVLGKHGQKKAA